MEYSMDEAITGIVLFVAAMVVNRMLSQSPTPTIVKVFPAPIKNDGDSLTHKINTKPNRSILTEPNRSILTEFSPSKDFSQTIIAQTTPRVQNTGTDVLVHNVSHTDVVFGINTNKFDIPVNSVIARPKFSCFRHIHLRIWDAAKAVPDLLKIAMANVFCHRDSELTFQLDENGNPVNATIGFDVSGLNVLIKDMSILKFRGKDFEILSQKLKSYSIHGDVGHCMLHYVYFPLLAILLPKWLDSIAESGRSPSKKVIYLITGQGTPRDMNADVMENSTEYTAMVMKLFINRIFPDISVELVHSGRENNLFRYDDNIKFVKVDLMPHIERLRDEMVLEKGEKWKDYFNMTISFADGSSARVSAINAAARQYRPSFMHFWQLKSFWHDTKVT